ncbi:DEAD/DEAH box helicase [Marnyiella aurantia]|uniref:DEAD/DEAH box helicase n=1 Tax=Marnyiella aurantia TaxID=2758037 RepID=UPI001E646FB3|nr:DEAD/DEAH box helicase [Marnyiella aurantia]
MGAAIKSALKLIKAEKKHLLVAKQIEITNNILKYLTQEISQYQFMDDLVYAEGLILEGVFDKLNSKYTDLKLHLSEIMPLTRLTQSELFTGGNVGLSLDAELKKEIRSSDRIDLLVSFIKWKAIVILRDAFQEFTSNGGKLRIITTTYMGATDAKAIHELSKLPNTEVKVSYNNSNERLHAKAYLFFRNSGFHTGYIGSSNFSRSALTDGLEWNVKVTTKEIPHIIDKFQKTFESYWNNAEFELYDESKLKLLDDALQNNKMGKATLEAVRFFDLKPYHYQSEILEKLKVERNVHNSYRNLIVAATGTGKTMIAAFDFKKFLAENPTAKFLFIAHRIEILKQSLHTFRNVLKDQNFGELYGNGYEPKYKNAVFATVQTLSNLDFATYSSKDYFDYIILDEAHHGQARTYQKVINYFTPKILLGLTATPERMDGKSILPDFNNKIAAEIRLPDALNNKLLCPFQYFGISDSIDYSRVKWSNGKYDSTELTQMYTSSDIRVGDIIKNLNDYTKDLHSVSAIGFCISIEHAKFMKSRFEEAGLHAEYLVSENSSKREEIIHQFTSKQINYLFAVDIFNEGIDIPQIDTVLFLRPTESLTIFLQQLGRGLRLSDDKDVLTVLDFVGQARDEYDFENKFRALIGKTNTTVLKEIEQDFPHLPLGCSIVLEKKAKDFILENIRKATSINKRQLISKIHKFQFDTHLELTLSNFLAFYNLRLQQVYKNYTFSELVEEALRKTCDKHNYANYKSMLSNKLMATESLSYFQFILQLIDQDFQLANMEKSENINLMATMFYYDFYQSASKETSLEEGIRKIGDNKDMVKEIHEFISFKIAQINYEEFPLEDFAFPFPLKLHSRYTRDQILVAMQLSTVESKSSSREGVAENKDLKCEALFVNLKKSEEDFSPTTMYDDYAINESLFHWQSQNQTADTSEKGKSYINQEDRKKAILLFVRESKTDADGFTRGYVFVGPVNFVEFTGSKPMSITWQLEKEMPHFLWQESAKLQVG